MLKSIGWPVLCLVVFSVSVTMAVAISVTSISFIKPWTTITYPSAKLGIYSDAGKTSNVTSIDWGTCYIGSSCSKVVYIVDTGNVNEVLSFSAANWNPASVSILEFTTDYNGTELTPNQVVKVTFTLTIPSNAPTGPFSFNIIVNVTGQ